MFLWNILFPLKDTNVEILEKQKQDLMDIITESNREKILICNERFVIDQDLKKNSSSMNDFILESNVRRYVRCTLRVKKAEGKIEMFENFVEKLDEIKSNLKLDIAMADLGEITETINKAISTKAWENNIRVKLYTLMLGIVNDD